MDQRFTQLKVLGRGSYGEALLVVDKLTRKHMVVKRLLPRKMQRQDDVDECLSEIRNIQSIHHLNIVKFYMAWVEASDQQIHMLFEYCDGGDLEHYLKAHYPLPEPLVVQFIAQLLIALDHLHIKHFIHRDIKTQNVLLCRSPLVLKLADFGLSKELANTDAAAQTCLGTPLYFSPEIAAMKDYTRKTDIWSLGVLCYEMLTNQFPFHGRTISEVLERIKFHQPVSPQVLAPQYHPELSKLVLKMLTKSRSQRPTARDLLSSPIFREPLTQWPWHPEWAGCRGLFVCRDNCNVNVRSAPNTQSEILALVGYGDTVIVSGDVLPSAGDVRWWHLVHPVEGYCISAQLGKTLFQAIDDAARASPFPRLASPVAQRGESPLRNPGPPPVAPAPSQPTTARGAVSPIRRLSPLRIPCASPLAHAAPQQPSPIRRPTSPFRVAVKPVVAPTPNAVRSPLRHMSPLRPAPSGSPLRRGG